MNKEKPKRIVLHGCYSAKNSDLGIRDRKGKLMNGEHDVFVVKFSKDKKRVKVKTITSLENVKKDGTSPGKTLTACVRRDLRADVPFLDFPFGPFRHQPDSCDDMIKQCIVQRSTAFSPSLWIWIVAQRGPDR